MQEQEQNRTEQATPFKLSEAKKRGQVAKSLDFNTLAMMAGLLVAAAMWGRSGWQSLCTLCGELFASAGTLAVDSSGTSGSLMATIGLKVFSLLLPFLLIGVLAAVLGNLLQTGPILSAHPLKPDFERLNPVSGFRKIFNKRALFEALKSLLKLTFFGSIAYGFLSAALPGLATLNFGAAPGQAAWIGAQSLALLFRLGLGLLVVGIIDLAFARWQFARQMMMSRREMKEEVKRREGDPAIRAKIRELQRENLKQARSIGRLPDADVLITNPEHYAIALRYDRNTMHAPVVLAKGSDHWAAQMRTVARAHEVPILERRRLARLIFRLGAIDQPIPSAAFVDVARVYAELELERRSSLRYEAAHR